MTVNEKNIPQVAKFDGSLCLWKHAQNNSSLPVHYTTGGRHSEFST